MNVSAVPFSISIKHPSNKPALTCPGGAPCCGVCRGLSLRWWLPLPKMWMGQRTGLCKRADQKSQSKCGTLLLTVNPFIACFDVKVNLSSFEQVKAESPNGQGGSDIFQGLSRCLHYQHGWSTFVRPAASLWPCGLFLGWTSAGCSFEQKHAYVLWHSMRQKRTVPFKQQLTSGLSENQITSCVYPCYTLLSDFLGRFQGWGAGEFGQLGDNRATSSDRPVHVRGDWFLWFSQWPMHFTNRKWQLTIKMVI